MENSSQFPRFSDGDVTIVISISRIYQLHSHVLRRLSPFFAAQLDVSPGAKLTAAAKRERAAAYRFELNRRSPEAFGRFVRIRVSESGKPHRDNYAFPDIGDNFGNDDKETRLWDWLFGSFYHIKPNFADHNLAIVLHDCMSLVDAADSIGSLDHVCSIVDHALLNQDQVLWRSIAANPTAWTELGCRIYSKRIFREGMVHLVGIWQRMTEEEKQELRSEIRNLCEQKYHELSIAKQAIDMRILGHYPASLHRNYLDKPDRTSYSTDIYMWMNICFFRHYFAQAIAEGRTRTADDGGYAFYNALSQGGDAYLHHEDFRAFHQYFPMSSKACNVLETNMTALKEDVKEFVQDLVVVRTHLKPGDYPVKWLTCAVIGKHDCPWEKGTEATAATGQQQLEDGSLYDMYGDARTLDAETGVLSDYQTPNTLPNPHTPPQYASVERSSSTQHERNGSTGNGNSEARDSASMDLLDMDVD